MQNSEIKLRFTYEHITEGGECYRYYTLEEILDGKYSEYDLLHDGYKHVDTKIINPNNMLVAKEFEFDMAHRLPNHDGLCKNLHGHRYKVVLTFEGEPDNSIPSAPDEGMVVDFHKIKEVAKTYFDETLDHGCMLSTEYDQETIDFLQARGNRVIPVDFVPTAENMSLYMFNILQAKFLTFDIKLVGIKVYETPTAFAEYKIK